MHLSLRFRLIANRNGTGVLVVSPTRELALQIFGVARELLANHSQTCISLATKIVHIHAEDYADGIIMGGASRRAEAEKLAKGINLIMYSTRIAPK